MLPLMTSGLREALEQRELRVERAMTYPRLALIAAFGLLDGLSSILHGAWGWAAAFLTGALLVTAWVLGIHRLARAYRPWLKYATTTGDYAIVVVLYVLQEGAPFLEQVPPGQRSLYFVFTLAAMNSLSAFRVGAPIVAWSTGLAMLVAFGILRHGGVVPTLFALAVTTVGLTGLIAFLLGRSTASLFVSLRRRDQLARFFPREIMRRVDEGSLLLQLGGAAREVTVLMSDIRGFTTLSETRDPAEVVELLNEYFTVMAGVVHEHGGAIDKYIGDAILAVWGAPEARADDPERAVRAAIGMQEALARLNERRAAREQAPIEIGVAVHTGIVVAGGIGSPERLDYTVIGDAVNVAARLEGLTKSLAMPVLFSEATWDRVKELIPSEAVGEAEIRGRQGKVRLFRPKGLAAGPEAC